MDKKNKPLHRDKTNHKKQSNTNRQSPHTNYDVDTMCIQNTPIRNNIRNDKVEMNWYHVPYKDQHFYWTPRDIANVQVLGDLMRVTNINFNMQGFQAQFDVQITTVGNVKVDAKPTHFNFQILHQKGNRVADWSIRRWWQIIDTLVHNLGGSVWK